MKAPPLTAEQSALFESHLDTALRTAVPLRGDVPLDDARQEAAIILLACVRSYDPTRGVPFGAYLIKRLQWKMWRLRKAAPQIPYRTPTLDATAPETRPTLRDAEESLARLPRREAELLRDVFGLDRPRLSLRKLGERDGVSYQAAHRRVQRALQRIREIEGVAA